MPEAAPLGANNDTLVRNFVCTSSSPPPSWRGRERENLGPYTDGNDIESAQVAAPEVLSKSDHRAAAGNRPHPTSATRVTNHGCLDSSYAFILLERQELSWARVLCNLHNMLD